MSLLAKNMEIIRKQSSLMANAIISKSAMPGEIEYDGEHDALQLCIDGRRLFLHSIYNREREFKEMFRDVPDRVTRLIIFGLDDGSILHYIEKHYPRLEHLLIVEPHGTVLERFLAENDFSASFTPFKKVTFLINYTLEDAEKKIEELLITSDAIEYYNSVVSLFAYQVAYGEYYRGLVRQALKALRFYHVNKTTQDSFRVLWLINFWRNLRQAEIDVSEMRGVFEGRPAIIVSAGPSLGKNIGLLERLKEKALIIAVGSSISILESHGITPHFRVAIDGVKENELIFKNVATEKCPLIYSGYAYHPMIENYQGPKIHMSLTGHLLPNYLFEKAEWQCLTVRSGFSVANVAMDMLQQLKCSTIILLGQDLCYTEGRMHAHGAWDGEFDDKYVNEEVETVNQFGEKVYTDRLFLGMKLVFEKILEMHKRDATAATVINATEGGLKIEGMLHKSLAEVEAEYLTTTYEFEREIAERIAVEKRNLPLKKNQLKSAVDNMYEQLEELIELNEKNCRDISKTLQLVVANGGNKQIIKGMDKISKTFALMNGQAFYQQVIHPEFADTFKLRLFASGIDAKNWRDTAEKDLKVFIGNTLELGKYLDLLKNLTQEYRGEKTLNITIE
ncbi:motility associated factor glycosyltransferase family protein [Azotosporobacter soli]|uniref:motility associated factor glycosyltransferase family protein n=1 Tax=Azotosporobacter soli TaxID=3055040 RepID=UPI0031FE9D50